MRFGRKRAAPGEAPGIENTFFAMTGICKSFPIGDEQLEVLHGISLTLERGDYLSVLGPSGSGKSTLMNIIGCLDTATSGDYILNGRRIEDMTEEELAYVRNREIGFIFQNSELLTKMDALKNVELPLIYAGVTGRERTRRAAQMLERVGLQDRMHHYPGQLSGGQQQRVAIARALVTHPTLLLADEPTGALDQKTGRQVMELFGELNDEGNTIVMITHDTHIASRARRTVYIVDGEISDAAPPSWAEPSRGSRADAAGPGAQPAGGVAHG